MRGLPEARKELDRYSRSYRHPKLPALQLSDVYALFPANYARLPKGVTAGWPDKWPNADSPGVYLILDRQLNISYIGKASMGSTLGARLSSYFAYAKDGSERCRIVHDSWDIQPEFVATIAMPSRMAFEAAALEEYLIDRLQPPENAKGLR